MKIIGILNYNNNSFSDGGECNNLASAERKINELFSDGADIVDIGVSATSYGATLMSFEEEWKKLGPLLSAKRVNDNVSVDTYHYQTMEKVISYGIGYINDVTGGKDKRILELIAKNQNVKYICMYSLTLPADKDIRIKSVSEVYDWCGNKTEECLKEGITKDQLILDPGIGFVTNSLQSMELLKDISKLQDFDVSICIGHSRKSFLESIAKSSVNERDVETLACSIYLMLKNIEYVRVHNVKMHKKAFNTFNQFWC